MKSYKYLFLLLSTLVVTSCATVKTKKIELERHALNKSDQIAKNLIVGQWCLTTSNKVSGVGTLAPTIDKYNFKANGEVF
ncbi:hypothetical protein AB6T38_19195 [Aliiglaciecola sp. SL4]|uniref:hypothetical protein n=1 Tax=Aliiglaciecola sp. SL4 TaxID=3239806 RepID=UPI00355B0923